MHAGKPNFFPHRRAGWAAGTALLCLIGAPAGWAQQTPASPPATQATQAATPDGTTTPTAPQETPAKKRSRWIHKDEPAQTGEPAEPKAKAPAPKPASAPETPKKNKLHIAKDERVVQTKDTKAELRREQKYNPLVGKDATLPDKQLYDKALTESNKGHYDVARLDLQTLLNTYPDSQYLMRAKLAVANSWFQEGGSAALAQAEQEFGDFITFFPNAPEAAEAQMRMGDIYLKQMDVPDRDYAKALKAEDQYRLMMKTYPDAPPAVHKEAEQKLRDVQEVLAQREFDLGQFYQLRGNIPASIARYKTVMDTYPLFSHMDDTLIGLGDAYEFDANAVRAQATCAKPGAGGCLPEAAKSRLEQEYDGKAAAYYRDVVLNHSAAPHSEDAKERLQAMNLPLPTPTAQQVAASEALEGSRAQYTMSKRLELLLVRKPDTVTAAQMGAPPLEDAPATVAPTIVQQINDDFRVAVDPNAVRTAPAEGGSTAPETSASEAPAQPSPAPGISTPLTLSDVPTAGNTQGEGNTGTTTEVSPADSSAGSGGASVGSGGASIGAEVLTPGVASGSMTGAPVTDRASDLNSATGKPDANYGIKAPARPDNTPLPAGEAPAAAPDAVNEVQGKAQPAVPPANPNAKKKPKPEFDKNDESSSKHKKKKGVDKLNPF